MTRQTLMTLYLSLEDTRMKNDDDRWYVWHYGHGIFVWKRYIWKRWSYTISALPVATQAVCWPGIPKVARSRLNECSKSCDLPPTLHCAIRGAQGVLPYEGWGVRPVNWIYRFSCHCPQLELWWSTATRSSPLGYFSKLLQVIDNWTHILWQ